MTTAIPQNVDPVAYSIFQAIDDAHVQLHRSKAEMLRNIRRLDQLELASEAGASSTAQWLIRRFGIAASTAHEYVNVANRLGSFPYLEQRFEEGYISYSVVRLLLRYLTEENERELADMALEIGYHKLELILSGREETDGGGDDPPDHYLRLHQAKDGSLRFHGCLNPADGAAFKAALKLGEIAYCNLDDLIASGAPLSEEAIDAAREKAMEIEPTKPVRQTASGYGLPIGRMLVQALMGMVHMIRTTPKNSLMTPAAHVNIVATHDGRAYMPNNLGVRSDAIANILANANMRVNTVDDNGLIINTGRQFRLANAAQVNALMVMWGGQCAAPGCTHTRFIEMHHIEDWADGGHTDLDNLLPLCSACHSLVSEGYIRTVKDGSDIHFIYRDGTRFVSENYSMARRRDDAVTMAEFEQLMDEEFGDATPVEPGD